MKLTKSFRSDLEVDIAKQLDAAGVEYDYETRKIEYTIPARTARYIPDFNIRGGNIIIEGKGHFGMGAVFRGRFVNMAKNSAEQRQKFAFLKEQHPELDIRFIFSKASAPIYRGSPTTHGKWATDHGFKWCEKVIPSSWIKELKAQQKRKRKK